RWLRQQTGHHAGVASPYAQSDAAVGAGAGSHLSSPFGVKVDSWWRGWAHLVIADKEPDDSHLGNRLVHTHEIPCNRDRSRLRNRLLTRRRAGVFAQADALVQACERAGQPPCTSAEQSERGREEQAAHE